MARAIIDHIEKCFAGILQNSIFVSSILYSNKRLKFQGKNYQCWQCLVWFAQKEELGTHSCFQELNITGNVIYTCTFCATCSDDIASLR